MTTSAHDRAFSAVHQLFARVVAATEGDSFNTAAELELTISQARLLFALADHDRALSISDLADHLGLSVASTGRNVDRLVRKKLLTRTESAEDRRVKLVDLSAHGRELAEAHLASRAGALRRVLAGATDHQCSAIAEALSPLTSKEHDEQ